MQLRGQVNSDGPAWYVLHARPQRELLVASLVEDRLHLTAYLPEIVRPAGARPAKAPLFPGYLFVYVDLAAVGLTTLNNLPGVIRLVSFGDRPQPVPAQEVARLRQRVAEWNAQGGLPQHSFRPGQEVAITGGPLQGLTAVFAGPLQPAQRVRVLLHFLGALSEVELPLSAIAACPPPNRRPRRTRGRGRPIRSH